MKPVRLHTLAHVGTLCVLMFARPAHPPPQGETMAQWMRWMVKGRFNLPTMENPPFHVSQGAGPSKRKKDQSPVPLLPVLHVLPLLFVHCVPLAAGAVCAPLAVCGLCAPLAACAVCAVCLESATPQGVAS
jgi:hypothetical protein